jgi:hypothetical protein
VSHVNARGFPVVEYFIINAVCVVIAGMEYGVTVLVVFERLATLRYFQLDGFAA